MFETLRARGFDVRTLHHAEAILEHDLNQAAVELESALLGLSLPVLELIEGGGGEGQLTQRLRRSLSDKFGWCKHTFEVKKIVDGEERESLTHEIDHVKRFTGGTVALEIEWNNKDPFFDRDLENFKRLHADGVISVGCIVTRGTSLHEGMGDLVAEYARREGVGGIRDLERFYHPTPRQKVKIEKAVRAHGAFAVGWSHAFVADKFGEATTHWSKLEERIKRGVGNPCPLLLIGLPKSIATL